MRAGALACLVLAAALAGCTDSGPSSGSTADGDDSANDGIQAPTWSVGDSWTFDNVDAQGNTSTMSIVVTAEDGDDHIVDTNEQTFAYYDALTDISYLGKVRKSDLAGSQGSDRVLFFDFPLEAGKTWSTPWDGLDVDVEVTEVAGGVAHLEATAGATPFARYTYSVEDRFMGEIEFLDENGTMAFRMELGASGSDFTGTIYRYTLHETLRYSASEAGAQTAFIDFGDAINEARFRAVMDCTDADAGRVGAIVTSQSPDDPPHVPQLVASTQEPTFAATLDCTQADSGRATGVADIDPALDYYIDLGTAGPGTSIVVTVEPRTLQALEFPFASE